MAYTIDWEKQRVCVRYSKHCREGEILKAVIELQADHRFDSTYQALHDFSECEGLSFSPTALEEVAARNIAAAMTNQNLRIAIVTNRLDVLNMLRCFDEFGLNPYPIRTFDKVESANNWLNGFFADQ